MVQMWIPNDSADSIVQMWIPNDSVHIPLCHDLHHAHMPAADERNQQMSAVLVPYGYRVCSRQKVGPAVGSGNYLVMFMKVCNEQKPSWGKSGPRRQLEGIGVSHPTERLAQPGYISSDQTADSCLSNRFPCHDWPVWNS